MERFPDKNQSPNPVPRSRTLNCRGRLISLDRPLVMGILNLTPDSFSDGGRYNAPKAAFAHTERMLEQGAAIIDVGGYSSRPGAADISPEQELQRIESITAGILKRFPEAIVSVDTFRAGVAKAMLELGVHMINDISAGMADPAMLTTVGTFDAPYVLMHMQGKPDTMQQNPQYADVVEEVYNFFTSRIRAARAAGIVDIAIDPGFGFGKLLRHNYELFRNLDKFKVLGLPLMVGISRKSMIYRPFDTGPEDVAELTSAMHLKALDAGADILRVHDVGSAVRIVKLQGYLQHGAI